MEKILAIMEKDLVYELRTKEIISSTLVFSLLALVIFNFAFELRVENVVAVAPGVLWVAFAFGGVLGLGRTFAMEKDKGTLEGILLAPLDRGSIYLAKLMSNLAYILVVEAVTLPVFAVFFNLPVAKPWLFLTILLGTVGFAGVGTLLSAIAAHTRAREVMLPLLLFPITIPVVISSVKATGAILAGEGSGSYMPWLNLLLAYDAIFLAISYLVFEYVVEE